MTENTYSTRLARNLHRMLDEEEITVPMLAEWSGVGVSTIRSWLSGGTVPYEVTLRKVADVLNRPLWAFYKEEQ